MQSRTLAATVLLQLSKVKAVSFVFIKEEEEHIPFPKDVDTIIEVLNEEVGNLKYKPQKEEDHFENHLNNLLEDFYDKTGAEFGDTAYGSFYEHGGAYDIDFDYGLDPHGLPVHEHQHFNYNNAWGNPWAEDFEPHYIHVNYPDEQAYSFQVEPTIQYTRIEHNAPPEYQRPVPNFDHVDPEGYFNEWEDFYIEDYLGSPGHDHRHFNYEDPDPDFHNHHLLDPYAVERLYQPPVDAYFVPVVVDPIPTNYFPEEVIIEEVIDDGYDHDYQIPINLDYYLSDDYYVEPEPYYDTYEADPYYSPRPYLAPIHDDLDFLYEHRPVVQNYDHHGHGGHSSNQHHAHNGYRPASYDTPIRHGYVPQSTY